MNLLGRRPAALELLAERNFRNYFIADALFDFSAQMRQLSMAWLTLTLTGSQFWVGLVTGLPGVAIVLGAPLAGVAIDRYNRRNILVGVRLVFVALAVPIGILVLLEQVRVWHLVAAALAVGAVRSISMPALRAFITDLVGRRRVVAANALTGSSSSAGELAGPAVAGLMIAFVGIAPVFFTFAATFAMCGLLLLRVRPAAIQQRLAGSFTSQFREGLDYIRRTPPLPALMVVTVTQLPAAVPLPLMPVYARDVLDVGAVGYGAMSTALGAGFLVGSLATATVRDFERKGLALIVTAVVWDVCAVGFGFSRSFPLSVVLLFAMGVGGAVHAIFLLSLFQVIARDDMLGRVLSIFGLIQSSYLLGFILGGSLASLLGNEVAIVIGALGSTPVIVATYLLSPGLRRY